MKVGDIVMHRFDKNPLYKVVSFYGTNGRELRLKNLAVGTFHSCFSSLLKVVLYLSL